MCDGVESPSVVFHRLLRRTTFHVSPPPACRPPPLDVLLSRWIGKRIFTVDRHAGVAIAGLIPDGPQLASVARGECKQRTVLWGSPVPAKVLSGRVGTWAHAHTTMGWYWPFGCNALIAIMTQAEGPQLWMVEPSGMSYSCFGCVVEKDRQVAKFISRSWTHDDPFGKPFELEMSWVCTESGGCALQHSRRHSICRRNCSEGGSRGGGRGG